MSTRDTAPIIVSSDTMEEKHSIPYERRREQVRRAQKAHRARKDEYVKSLEEEVGQLRQQNAENVKKLNVQQSTIACLRNALTAGGLPIPTELVDTENSIHSANVSIADQPFPHQQLQVRLPAASTSLHHLDAPAATALQCRSKSGPSDSYKQSSQAEDIQFQYAHPQGLESAQIGIDFVLALERPCLYHHKETSPELEIFGSIGTGHERMLSASIMSYSDSFSPHPYDVGYPPAANWEVPTAELQSLLQRSQNLGLQADITPVQAWHEIRNHAKFGRLSYVKLDALRQEIFPLVMCYGFGAVLDRVPFSDLLSRTFDII